MMRMAEDINFPNEIYYSLFKNNQDACYGMDLMGNLILYNDAFLELSGYINEDLVGKEQDLKHL